MAVAWCCANERLCGVLAGVRPVRHLRSTQSCCHPEHNSNRVLQRSSHSALSPVPLHVRKVCIVERSGLEQRLSPCNWNRGLGEGQRSRPGTQLLPHLRPGRNASELLEEAEPVQLDPVLYQLAAGEAADDDDGPRHVAAGRGDPLPFALLGRLPVAAPDASVASKEHVVQGVGGVRKGGEEAFHRLAPGRPWIVSMPSQCDVRSSFQYFSRASTRCPLKTSSM